MLVTQCDESMLSLMLAFVKVSFSEFNSLLITTGPPNGPVLFCTLVSVVWRVSRRCANRQVHRRSGGRHSTAGQYGYIPLERHRVLFYLTFTILPEGVDR